MSARRRQLAVAVTVLVAGAAIVAALSGGEGDRSGSLTERPAIAAQARPVPPPAAELAAPMSGAVSKRSAATRRRRLRERIGDPGQERDARRSETRVYQSQRRAAESVAQRFLGAFMRYELGELGSAVRRQLEETATKRLAGELLAAPPRVPSGAAAPAPGRLVDLDFAPGESQGGRLARTEFVATLSRAGERDQVAISLRRVEADRWAVDGLGR